jgi:threonine dehydratase
MKILIEPSAAVPVAALLEGGVAKLGLQALGPATPGLQAGGLRVGVILSGGNLDLDALPWLGR